MTHTTEGSAEIRHASGTSSQEGKDRATPKPDVMGHGQRATAVGVWIVAVIVGGLALDTLEHIIVPLVLAVFLLVLVDGVARAQRRVLPFLPSWTGVVTGVAVVIGALIGGVAVLVAQAASVIGQASRIAVRLDEVLVLIPWWDNEVPLTMSQLIDDSVVTSMANTALRSLQGAATMAVLVAVYLAFMLASRAQAAAKFNRLFLSARARAEAAGVLEAVRRGTEEYMWLQTLTGVAIAVVSWGLMELVGLDNALVLALVIFLTGYVPVIGAALGVLVPPLFALAQLGTWTVPLLLLIALQLLNFVVNNVLLTRLQGDRFNIDPVAVLLALALWSYLWGLPGALLSTPLTVLVIAICAELPSARWLAVLLSRDGAVGRKGSALP